MAVCALAVWIAPRRARALGLWTALTGRLDVSVRKARLQGRARAAACAGIAAPYS